MHNPIADGLDGCGGDYPAGDTVVPIIVSVLCGQIICQQVRKIMRVICTALQLFVNGYSNACDVVPQWTKEGTTCPLSAEEIERFKYLFQKLCVLDYVIRNTDRHMENWLINIKPYFGAQP
ncbi:unnamed protein product [Gongylonema pulchrum]|uniref:Phosphatidylinositol 4-kinase type 2 n=1 Tax=Gongylonema pulchrum TaxID=637853 RepID=A0A183EBK0_9BILA|nr:unnamed protein product [Gongylonema pulchrum]